jgi:hypothetical protein
VQKPGTGSLTPLFSLNLANWQGPQPEMGNMSVRVNSTGTGLELIIVPEPGTVALAGIGIGLVGWAVTRRRRKKVPRFPCDFRDYPRVFKPAV